MSKYRSWARALAVLTIAPAAAAAQARGAAPLSATFALTAQGVPDAFSSRCGRQNFGSVGHGVGAALLKRVGHGFGVQADAHLLLGSTSMACITNLPTRAISPTEWETRPGVEFSDALPHRRYASTSVRAVYEVRRWAPVLRATVGGGALWARRPVPMGVASLGMAARGGRVRPFGDIEYGVSRVSASERRERFTFDRAAGATRSLGATTVSLTRVPRWTTLRAGVEIPFRSR